MKKDARDAVKKRLMDEMNTVRHQLYVQKREMKAMVERQTRMKRELVVLNDLVRSLNA